MIKAIYFGFLCFVGSISVFLLPALVGSLIFWDIGVFTFWITNSDALTVLRIVGSISFLVGFAFRLKLDSSC